MNNKAGVIVYREIDNLIEVLLVSARKYEDSWVFPVGTAEKGEDVKETAIRECMEESGYIVKIEDNLGSFIYKNGKIENKFSFFSGKVIGEVSNYETDRKRIWVGLDKLSEKVPDFLAETAEQFKTLKLVKQV